jgi:hypothetical protein
MWMALRNAVQVNKSFPTRGRLVSCLALLLLALVFSSQVLAQTRIVNCDAPVQSRKRGIGVNSLSDLDFRVLAPGVSWYYNWGATPLAKPSDVAMDFLPMAWNGSSGFQTSISSYLAAGNRPWRVLALNEPNFTTQANITPSNSATTFEQVKAICDPYNIPVIAPHMAIGTPANQSITAYDPIQGSNVTYTFQEPYLSAFLYYCGSTQPTGMATHSYGGYGEITWITGTMHTDFPTQTVWLTEFCPWGATSDAAVLATLIPAVDYCERTPWIEGYAWFMSRITGDPYNSLLGSSGVLTPAGQAYLQMPVHDTNLYYRIPGRLQAERYVTMNQMNIAPTTDMDGLADMISTAAGGSVDYNIQVDSPGSYPLSFRVAGATGQIRIYKDSTLLQAANVAQTNWSTVSTTVSLAAGTQTLHVVLAANAQQLNWMDFLATNGTPSVPFGLSATAGGTQVVLNWLTSAGATSYNVKCSTTNGGPYVTIASSATASYSDTGVVNCATYYYVVSATNSLGESANSGEATATLGAYALAVNSGGSAASPFVADAYVSGGTVASPSGASINTMGVTNPAPQAVYQTERYGTFTYTFGSLTTGTAYKVRLHFAEYYWNSANARKFNVTINGTQVLTNYDIFVAAGGQNKAIIPEFTTTPNGSGQIIIAYTVGTVDQPKSSGIEIILPSPTAPTGLGATPGDAQVALIWGTVTGATGYNVKRATSGVGPFNAVTNAVSGVAYTDTGLTNGTTYYYAISTVKGGCESTNSVAVSATPVSPLTPFEQWQTQYFGSISDPNAAPSADPDGDGFSNLQEFLAGTDPTNSASSFRVTSIVTTGNNLRVTWMMGPAKTNALQATNGGGYGTNGFADIFTVTNTLGTVTNYLDIGAAANFPARYYRVRLVP